MNTILAEIAIVSDEFGHSVVMNYDGKEVKRSLAYNDRKDAEDEAEMWTMIAKDCGGTQIKNQ
jgi:hypothetical protein